MKKEININFPKFLKNPIKYNNKMVKFFVVKSWVTNKDNGASLKWIEELNMNYIDTIEDLPVNSGIYITGYDADLRDLEKAVENKIPIIDNPCPWIRKLRDLIISIDKDKYQCVLLIDQGHLVYNCFKYIFPEDIIIIDSNNFKEKLSKFKNDKPIYLLAYATFRKKDVKSVIEYINLNFYNQSNNLNSYNKTLCQWTNQGLFEEINHAVKNHRLDEIWIICNSENNRSTKSIVNEVIENHAKPVIVKNVENIPAATEEARNIGVLLAPIPLNKNTAIIKELLKNNN